MLNLAVEVVGTVASLPSSGLARSLNGWVPSNSPSSWLGYMDESDDIKDSLPLAIWRVHGAASARIALECSPGSVPDLRWPTGALCPECWSRCFRRGRFCWSPWENERQLAAAKIPDGFADAMPNHAHVAELLHTRYSGFEKSPLCYSLHDRGHFEVLLCPGTVNAVDAPAP